MLKTEHIDHLGFYGAGVLRVPVQVSTDPTPKRKGWVPYFVATNMDGHSGWVGNPQKIVSYRKEVQA